MIPKKINSRLIYSSEYLDLYVDKIKLNSGKTIEKYHVIKFKHDSVIIIIINKRNELCFINSTRYLTRKMEWELPAGSMGKNEDEFDAGKREALEETGYEINNLKILYTFNPANSITDQKVHVLISEINDIEKKQNFNTDEVNSIKWLSIDKIRKMITKNNIRDGFTLIALFVYLEIFNKNNNI